MVATHFSKIILALALAVFTTACTPEKFVGTPTSAPTSAQSPSGRTDPAPLPGKTLTESFTQNDSANKVDILVIDDNSLSMETEQKKMAERFPSFVSSLGGLDYHIAVTTTDVDSKNPDLNLSGRALDWAGTSSNVLTPATPDASSVFKNTIKRTETIGCVKRGECPSGNEQPLKATMLAIDQRNSANAGIFRDGVDLAVVILSDEDEMSNGPAIATKPSDVINNFNSNFGHTKRLRTFGIVIPTGDTSCLKTQKAQTADGDGGSYGTHAQALAALTGGSTHSICENDYSQSLADISQSVRKLVGSFELNTVPKTGSILVTLTPTPSKKISWHVEGKNLIFDTPPAAGTRIDVSYQE